MDAMKFVPMGATTIMVTSPKPAAPAIARMAVLTGHVCFL